MRCWRGSSHRWRCDTQSRLVRASRGDRIGGFARRRASAGEKLDDPPSARRRAGDAGRRSRPLPSPLRRNRRQNPAMRAPGRADRVRQSHLIARSRRTPRTCTARRAHPSCAGAIRDKRYCMTRRAAHPARPLASSPRLFLYPGHGGWRYSAIFKQMTSALFRARVKSVLLAARPRQFGCSAITRHRCVAGWHRWKTYCAAGCRGFAVLLYARATKRPGEMPGH